jgi:hypothetical protein
VSRGPTEHIALNVNAQSHVEPEMVHVAHLRKPFRDVIRASRAAKIERLIAAKASKILSKGGNR